MTAVLDRVDIDFLEEEVDAFETQNGEVIDDGETPEVVDCGGNCFGVCTAKVRADG